MRPGTKSDRSSGNIFIQPGCGRFLPRSLNFFVWLWLITALSALLPHEVRGAKQKTVRKDAPKGKPAPASPASKLTDTPAHKTLLPPPIASPVDPLEKREHVIHRVRAGETLSQVLARYYVPDAEKQFWVRSIMRNMGSQVLPAGKEVHLYFAKPAFKRPSGVAPGTLKSIEFDQSDAFTLTWEKGIRGILFQKREKPYDVELKTISASVENSLFEDGAKAGIQPALLSQVAEIFTWDLDFEKDIRHGDSIKILYEQRSRKGQEQKDALRFPLEFISITSHFAESRLHPILRTHLPHPGVDFAAQRGTPIRAVGDGIVAEAGWNGAYGKAIDIKHDATYTSRYAHLGSFADGIHGGVAVTKGQIIGYVGSTGRATGPHLHFELYKDQQFVNPLSVDFPAEETIEPALQILFEHQMRTYLVELTSTPQS